MAINRLSGFHLSERPMFTALYGSGIDDIFIDKDLRRCNLYQTLYREFKAEGYTVVFYSSDTNYNLFSYSEDDLAAFYRLKNKKADTTKQSHRHIAQISSPFGEFRRNRRESKQQTEVKEVASHYEQITLSELMSRPDDFFRIKVTVDIFNSIVQFAYQEPKHKLVVIFTTASTDNFDNHDQILAKLTNLKADYRILSLQFKLVAIYSSPNIEELKKDEGAFFLDKFFKDMILPDEEESKQSNKPIPKYDSDYYLGQPSIDEVSNILNRKRLLEGVNNTLHPIEFGFLCKRITQEIAQNELLLRDLDKKDAIEIQRFISSLDTDKAIDKFNSLKGIDNIKKQFAQYRNALFSHRAGTSGARFRPHMALMGSPGTGKSTVARLFGKILSEDGLLPIGHFIKTDVSELVGEYVGSTRPKTRAVCERARGGVLFIDEAYGLMSGNNGDGQIDYGKEAIEVLIQFMEDNDDSLVIFAGYTEEITELIDKGNKGFRRRFNDLGFFNFNDYSPEVLYDISINMIPVQYTDQFALALKNLIKFKHAYRNKKFGNVGDMENLVNLIVGSYRQSGSTGPLDISHIPDNLRILVDPSMLNEEKMLSELNALIGQDNVKTVVRRLFNNALASRHKIATITGYQPEMKRLNYIFSGNPGTGKTTIARIIGEVLQKLGILQSNDADPMIEISGNDLLTATPARIKELFENSIGRVLFIDEAYQLREQPRIIADIVGNITNKDYENKMCLILAGYTYDMQQMININPGMTRRFEVVYFKDYTNEELFEILVRLIENPKNQAKMDIDSCRDLAISYFNSIDRDQNFGNAGIVTDKLLPILKENRDMRYNSASEAQRSDEDFALRIQPVDFPNYNLCEDKNDTEGRNSNYVLPQAELPITLSKDYNAMVQNNNDFIHAVGLLEGKAGKGSAFIISVKDKYIMTASHVVENDTHFRFTMYEGKYTTPARVIWNDFTIDMAILQLEDIPVNALSFVLDNDITKSPETLEEIIHCGFIKGTNISINFNTYSDRISNFESSKQYSDGRCFDTIMSSINAAEGCSGGPVFRNSDKMVIGILQGGFLEGGTRIITDIHQLFRNEIIKY